LRAISLSRPDGEAAYRPQLNLTGERPATFLKAALKPLSDSKKNPGPDTTASPKETSRAAPLPEQPGTSGQSA
jgi:hypothetical protein